MNQDKQQELIILNNILFLAESSKVNLPSSRNLLNKWFQDSVKCYILESVAAPLIAKQLCFTSTALVKKFIHSQAISKDKPKYMNIIDQYFFYIKKFNQQNHFIQELKLVLSNSENITQKNTQQAYNTKKNVRKQFVCILLLKYFEIYEQQEIPSFYELWNICYPQEIQTKKKLTKFDKRVKSNMKEEEQEQEEVNFNESLVSSNQNLLNCRSSLSLTIQSDNLSQQITTYLNSRQDNVNQFYESTNADIQSNDCSDNKQFKQPINNGIFQEDSYDEESMDHFLNYKPAQYQMKNYL
ncbi:hypothetical protein ABPG72_002588 [Tetrahymena utriculariae]